MIHLNKKRKKKNNNNNNNICSSCTCTCLCSDQSSSFSSSSSSIINVLLSEVLLSSIINKIQSLFVIITTTVIHIKKVIQFSKSILFKRNDHNHNHNHNHNQYQSKNYIDEQEWRISEQLFQQKQQQYREKERCSIIKKKKKANRYFFFSGIIFFVLIIYCISFFIPTRYIFQPAVVIDGINNHNNYHRYLSSSNHHDSSSSSSKSSSKSSPGSNSNSNSDSSSSSSSSILVVGGNFTLDNTLSTLARYDLEDRSWSTRHMERLYLYGYSSGIVFDLVVNHTDVKKHFDELFVVGAFDTTCSTCQSQYCSVGRWRGEEFKKVGDGLCPHSNDPTMRLYTSIIGNNGDVYVGGVFTSNVWSGTEFVKLQNMARFVGKRQAWLPITGGFLTCTWCDAEILSMTWDPVKEILFIGGKFNAINDTLITPGLAIWNEKLGLQPFPGGGLSLLNQDLEGVATALTYDSSWDCLFVAGTFSHVGGIQCSTIAFYQNFEWHCLSDYNHYFDFIQTMALSDTYLYVAGLAAKNSTWHTGRPLDVPYTVAKVKIFATRVEDDDEQHIKYNDDSDDNGKYHEKGKDYLKRHLSASSSSSSSSSSLSSKKNHYQGYNSKNTNSNRDSSSSSSSSSKSSSKSKYKYEVIWNWLPGFGGCNDQIFTLLPVPESQASEIWDYKKGKTIKKTVKDNLFIGGQFTNYPSIVVWYPGKNGGGTTSSIGTGQQIQGVVHSIKYMRIKDIDGFQPHRIVVRHTWSVLFICIMIGLLLGCLATGCFISRSKKHKYNYLDEIPLSELAGPTMGTKKYKVSLVKALTNKHIDKGTHNLQHIEYEDLSVNERIGEGSFGCVWKGHWCNSVVAIKEFQLAQLAIKENAINSEEMLTEIVGEAVMMDLLRHPKVLQLYGCSISDRYIYIICEYCCYGSLRNVLDNHVLYPLTTYQLLQFAREIAEGMTYLHGKKDNPVIHRDLKTQNIFVKKGNSNEGMCIKIGDWGSARSISQMGNSNPKSMTQGIGTACWMANEVIMQNAYSKASDVYAFGIILWELATREEVYKGLTGPQVMSKVAYENFRPEVPAYCPWGDLMERCWSPDPKQRPTFEEISLELSVIDQNLKPTNKNRQIRSPPLDISYL